MEKKELVLEIGKVRINKFDSMNLVVSKLQEKEVDGEIKSSYIFKGYASTLLDSLKLISRKELLIEDVKDLDDYISKTEKSNKELMEIYERS